MLLLIVSVTKALTLMPTLASSLAVKPSEPSRFAVSSRLPVVLTGALTATVLLKVTAPLSLCGSELQSTEPVVLLPRV